MTIAQIIKDYKDKLDYLDIEILIASSLGKTREFVLTYPEYKITSHQSSVISKLMERRISGEPVAYLVGHKEFFGLDFIVNKHTLVPRPETEMMVEEALSELQAENRKSKVHIADIGTGSGSIVVSIANQLKSNDSDMTFYASDISSEALKIARKNAKSNGVGEKIK